MNRLSARLSNRHSRSVRPMHVYKGYCDKNMGRDSGGPINEFVILYYKKDEEILDLEALRAWFPCHVIISKGF